MIQPNGTNPTMSVILEKSRWYTLSRNKHKRGVGKVDSKQKSQNKNLTFSGELPIKRWGHIAANYKDKMIIHGGRFCSKSLSSLFMFNPNTFVWTKIEQSGTTPCQRDSHTGLVYQDNLYIFGGVFENKKFNDLWKFSFLDLKWTKIASPDAPKPKEGHTTCLYQGKYMIIQGGLDENERIVSDLHLFDLTTNQWFNCSVKDYERFAARECRSCVSNGDYCYMFGGEANEISHNDLFRVNITYLNDSGFHSKWVLEEPKSKKPPERSSHSCVFLEPDILIITGGEGKKQSKIIPFKY